MKQDKQRHNWLIDAALFGGFLGSLWLDLTGVAVHQWLGLAVGGLVVYHLVKHWTWVKAVTGRFFGRTSAQSRTCYVVDAGLAIGFAAITITGLVISTWLDLALASYAAWRLAHVVASVGTLALVVVKIGLHWRWIVNVARRNVFRSPAPAPTGQAGTRQPAPVANPVGRRDFVRLMAGVSAVALLAGTNALAGSLGAQAEDIDQTTAPAATVASSQSSGTTAATFTTCRVRCNRRCSYPGHCRKYVDSNRNGRCDLGECTA